MSATRRGFLGGLLALVAAPAVVRAASLMPVRVMPDEEVLVQLARRNSLVTLNQITREAMRLFNSSNAFIESLNKHYDDSFAAPGAKIGTQVRIRLPSEYARAS